MDFHLTGSSHVTNISRVQNTEKWPKHGTLQHTIYKTMEATESPSAKETVCEQSCRKEAIQSSTQPLRPYEIMRRSRRIRWSKQSNAVLRSRVASRVTLALSAASKMADVIPSIAVSTE